MCAKALLIRHENYSRTPCSLVSLGLESGEVFCMLRKNRFQLILLLGLANLPVQTSNVAQTALGRPNIFMILSDDVTTRDLGCYGNPAVGTPRIDQLAREGRKFTNMFTASPSCSPSRAVLFTGLYPFRNGGHPNHSEVKAGTKSVAHYLSSLGYRVILMGKFHAKPPSSFPFEFYEDDETTLGTTKVGKDLRKVLASLGDKPVCILYAKFDTHYPWPHNNYHYDPRSVALQPYLVDTPETRQMRANYYSKITEMDQGVGQVLDLLKEYKLEANTLTLYTADHGSGWPHERDMLYDPGINVPFIARWPGKIQPGTVTDALTSYVDVAPTFIEAAGGNVGNVVAKAGGAPLDGRSFLPILLGRQMEHHTEVFATHTSNVASAYPMRAVRTLTHKYIWNIDSQFYFPSTFTNEAREPEFMTRWPVWQSWMRKAKTDAFAAERVQEEIYRPAEELYDIGKDPYELKNLAEDPAHKAVLLSLRQKVKAWMKQQDDAGDSAYHKDVEIGRNFVDEVYHRQKLIRVKIKAPRSIISDDVVHIELTCPIWRAEIHYTLDGAVPTRSSKRYTEPLVLQAPVAIKAKAFWKGSDFWQGGETPIKEVTYTGVDFRFLYEGHNKPVYR